MAAPPFRVKAVYDYASGHDDDLSFPNGQIITVTDVEDDDWYFGEYANAEGAQKKGLFPKNFVERYEPITPPRPTRPAKKEHESGPPAELAASPVVQETQSAPVAKSVPHQAAQQPESDDEEEPEPEPEPATAQNDVPLHSVRDGASETQTLPIRAAAPVEAPLAAPSAPRAVPPPAAASKSPPPPVSEKPVSSSFRDRIAAFNKPAAPPVAPKPVQTGGSSFVKKPFVPPPPSRNAYVPIPKEPPPQKIYRREEDPSLAEPDNENVRPLPPPVNIEGDAEDQPKPTSLKERIALLQKQQLEQAARHSEAAAKKEAPKKPLPSNIAEDEESEPEDKALSEYEEDSGAASRPPRASSSYDRTTANPPDTVQRESLNDPDDADQSASGETEDGEASHRKRAPREAMQQSSPVIQQQSSISGDAQLSKSQESSQDEDNTPEQKADEEENEEVDPEIQRRLEIRERMAKMSGGMGMAGMFGPPGGLPGMAARKPKTANDSSKHMEEERHPVAAAQPIPVMALPGMAMPGISKLRSPEPEEHNDDPAQAQQDQVEESEDDEPSHPLPPVPSERPVPVPPIARAVPPVPASAAARAPPPLPPPEARSPPTPVPVQQQILSAGEDSDDELSTAQDTDTPDTTTARRIPPAPIPVDSTDTGPETAPISPSSAAGSPRFTKSSTFPQSTTSTAEKRVSRQPPPIPSIGSPTMSPSPAIRAPPPPPPPTREATGVARLSTSDNRQQDEEVTEYEGDYDTDIAAGQSHRNALTADQSSGAEDTLTGDEASYHHSGLPSLGPPRSIPGSAGAPRGVPPPLPPSIPRTTRQSSDLPRPPPLPPSQASTRSRQSNDLPRGLPPPIPQASAHNEDDYDPYNYNARPTPQSRPSQTSVVASPRIEPEEDLYGTSPPRSSRAPPQAPRTPSLGPPPQPPSAAPPALAAPQPDTKVRQSLDVPRATPGRSSIEGRPSMDQQSGFMASEIDVAKSSYWWTQRKMPPPSLKTRNDVAFEVEESTAIQQNGGELVLKLVYVLFMDYSQTIVKARFSQSSPDDVDITQRTEPPPVPLRQDQLEAAHSKHGAKLAELAAQKVNHIIGDGTPLAFVTEILHRIPDAIPAIGSRVFGAVVYANLANASVQQHDEIRTGDIITFRNARLQGHKGPMKTKYSIEVGKPDHVAVVVDWDGTKKKIRAWEQGRESKKVKIESFKLEDLRSGEIKIWRVVGRDWIGWGNKS